MNSSDPSHCLFIALWPPHLVLQQLAEITASLHVACGGRKIIQCNQHVTVVFLGHVMPGRVAHVQRALQAAAGEQFELELDVIEMVRSHLERRGARYEIVCRAPLTAHGSA